MGKDERENEISCLQAKRGSERLLAAIREHHDFNSFLVKPKNLPKPKVCKLQAAVEAVKSASVQTVFKDKPEEKLKELGITDIKRVVCSYFKMDPLTLESARRGTHVVYPRQLAMWLCSKFTRKSLPMIGRHFGDRDHTTVLHAIRAVGVRIELDAHVTMNRVVRSIASDAADLEKICRGLV